MDSLRGTLEQSVAVESTCAALALHRLLTSDSVDRPSSQGNDLPVDRGLERTLQLALPDSPWLWSAFESLRDISPDTAPMLAAVAETDPSNAGILVEELLARRDRADTYGRGESVTSETLRTLVKRLAKPEKGDVVFDPAAGQGGFLVAAGLQTPSAHLMGQEINQGAWRIAVLRLIAHGLSASDVRLGDSLRDDQFPDRQANVVVCDPPYGMRDWGGEQVGGDARWQFGLPSRDADMAWIQHMIHHLGPSGRGYALLPSASLFRGGSDGRVRREMIRRGAIDAIVALPPGLSEGTTIPLALWMVRSPTGEADQGSVLLVEVLGSEPSPGTRGRKHQLEEGVVDSIVEAVEAWREGPEDFEDVEIFAAAVRGADLLARADASLVPTRWVQAPDLTGEDAISEVRANATRLTEEYIALMTDAPSVADLPLTVVTGRAPDLRISDLADEGHVSILRASRISPEDYRDVGTPVLTQSALRRGRGAPQPDRYVDPSALPRAPVLTEPGDVILATIGDRPFAVAFMEGGWVLGGSLQALRVHADWLDPYVAAYLSGSRTAQRSVGVAIRHVKLRDLELPNLTPSQATTLRELLERTRRLEEGAREVSQAAESLRTRIVDGVVSGAIEVLPTDSGGA